MKAHLVSVIATILTVTLPGCKAFDSRPSAVPPSAILVENNFVDCSADSPSTGNHCSIYRKDSGELLADGLFRTTLTHDSVDKSELRYAAVGYGMIYLQDGRVLTHVRPSERDPSREKTLRRLETLATNRSSSAVDCNREIAATGENVDDCARRSLARHRAFYAVLYSEGDGSFEFSGVAANEVGEAYNVDYESAWVGPRPNSVAGSEVFDDGHTEVSRCPNPVTVNEYPEMFGGPHRRGIVLTCFTWHFE